MQWVVIADEFTALGWRLAGAQIRLSDAQSVGEHFAAAQRNADLVFITAELAAHLPAPRLQDALRAQKPLVLVLADLLHRQEASDIIEEVRHALGVAL